MKTATVRALVLVVLIIGVQTLGFAQARVPAYHTYYDFLLASPGALRFGLNGFDNPALLQYVRMPDLTFAWSNTQAGDLDRWGLFAAGPHSSFGMLRQYSPAGSLTDYRVSFGMGNRSFSLGAGFLWSSGDRAAYDRANMFTLGALIRPSASFSLGFIGTTTYDGSAQEGVLDLALRPLASPLVTLFADYALQQDQSLPDGNWSAGAAFEPWAGVRLTGRYLSVAGTEGFTIGLNFSLGYAGFTAQHHGQSNGAPSYQTYGVRVGGYDRNILSSSVLKNSSYYSSELTGRLDYRRYLFFDSRKTLLEQLQSIDAAKADPRVRGIVLSVSGLSAPRELLWELREKLLDFKTTGKTVVIYLDRADMDLYHLASAADRIVMDPLGMITLEGYVIGRTYFKGTLEKLGVGYDEWRFFTYKSASESFSREGLSKADREQLQELADDAYALVRDDVVRSGRLSADQFDDLVNARPVLMAREARTRGLVDTLLRWDGIGDFLKDEAGSKPLMLSASMLEQPQLPYDGRWGEPRRIALIYALGICDMDAGIAARRLVKDVEDAVNDHRIKAIVLRVDSPGGDALASDYIAEALRKAKGKKPVIVSQGSVAGSGGYWLSMYADTIVAAPNTITGSIGVIGGWFYDKGLKSSLGISTDLVKAGEHADLGFGFSLPLIGSVLPDRNLTEPERAQMEEIIRALYKEFVEKVASGRRTSPDNIEAVAQGRVWSGTDGAQVGLVDILGGLDVAIRVAKERAGIPATEEIEIVEAPAPGWFNLEAFIPRVFAVKQDLSTDPLIEYITFRLRNNGVPLPLVPFEDAYIPTDRP